MKTPDIVKHWEIWGTNLSEQCVEISLSLSGHLVKTPEMPHLMKKDTLEQGLGGNEINYLQQNLKPHIYQLQHCQNSGSDHCLLYSAVNW